MSRSRRSKSQASAAAEGISILDKLILAQSVWEVGPSSWLKISRMLGKHPLLSHPKTFFTAQSCHAMYNHMMKESGFDLSDANNVAHAPTHLKLAEKYYGERVEELRTLISNEEQQFKAIVAEIDQIRAGQRDEELKARITGISVPEKETEDMPAVEEETPAVEDEASAVEVEAPAVEVETPVVEVETPVVEVETPAVEETPAAEEPQVVIAEEQEASANTDNVVPEDEPPAVDTAVAEPEKHPDEEAPSDAPVPPTHPKAAMEDVEAQAQETETIAPTPEPTPPPDVPSSPPENLDHLMQASDDETHEKAQDVEVQEPVLEEQKVDIAPEQAPEDEIMPMENVEPTVETGTAELATTQNDGEAMDQSESKPVSRNSDVVTLAESEPAEENISTRRSTRRRPSISLAPAPAPAPPRKRGRRPLPKSSPEPEPEAEPEPELGQVPTPSPAVKDATPVVEETQPDEEVPLSAAIRRRESKRKASFFGGLDSPRQAKRAREDSEPVDDDETGSGSAVLRRRGTGRTEEQVALKRFQTVITMVHSQISQHRNGNIFHNPIKTSEAPDYHDIVKRPIDLKTIKAKIKDGVIGNSLEYQRDICLMFANAMMYNRPGSDVHVMAEDMMVESDSHINTFRQTETHFPLISTFK